MEVYEKKSWNLKNSKEYEPCKGTPPPPLSPGYALTLSVLSHSDGKMEIFFILEVTNVEETKCTP